jgi:hypothetical protein
LLTEFRERGAQLDAACRALIDGHASLVACHRSLLSLGVRSPGPDLLAMGCRRSVIAALQETDLAMHRSPTSFLAPGERRTFGERVEEWAGGIASWAAARLEPET